MITGECLTWESPFDRSIEAIVSRRGSPVVVLASGDPFLYGVGATLSRSVMAGEMRCIPAPSSFSLAAVAAWLAVAG
jgi:precorrin-6Y C5,15-methyltransferase (decarboxylating)